MRRRMLLLCCAVLGAGGWAAPASAEVRVIAPAEGLTGQEYRIVVEGSGPFDARVRFQAQAGTSCTPDYGDWERASGPFRHEFTFAQSAPGPWALCARLVGPDDDAEAPGSEQAVAVIQLREALRQLTLAPVHPVAALGERVAVRVSGVTEVETGVWAWVRALDGPPCSDAPWVGDQVMATVRGSAGAVLELRPITVPGTYRVCAHLWDAGASDPRGVLETQVVVSQACTDAHRARALRTASYRRARAAYRRAHGRRRVRLRRVMVRRRAAMDRARDQVRTDC